MKILIIGGAGFVGANLAIKFKNEGHTVTVMDNLVRRGSEFNIPRLADNGITFSHGDTRNKEDFINIGRVDLVLDCAAQPSAINYSNPNFDIINNTFAVLNVLDYCRANGAGLIFWSTNKCYTGKVCNSPEIIELPTRYAYKEDGKSFEGFSPEKGFNEKLTPNGNDHSIYGVSKIMADLMIQEYADAYKIPAICNRFSCLAGPYQWGKAEQGWVAWFAIANELELPITIFGYKGKQVRDYLFIDDVFNLINKQAQRIKEFNGEVFNVGGGNFNTSILEAISLIEEKYKKFSKIEYDSTERRADQIVYITDTTKVSETFDWKPTIDLEKGYEQIFDWIHKNKNLLTKLYKI